FKIGYALFSSSTTFDNTSTGFGEKLKEKLWPEAEKIRATVYIWQPVHYRGSGKYKRKVKDTVGYWPALVERGRFHAEKSTMVYRSLEKGKTYLLGDKLHLVGRDMHIYHLVKGGRRTFTVGKSGKFKGTVLAAINTYQFKVEVQNQDGVPLENAIVFAKRTAAEGKKRLGLGRTDEKGKAEAQLLQKGTYRITVEHPKLKFGHKDVEIPATKRVVMRAEGRREPTRGALVLHATDRDGKPLHLNARIALYRDDEKNPLTRSAVPRKGMAKEKNLKPDRYLVVMHSLPEGASLDAFAPDGLRFTVKEIEVKAGKNQERIRESKGIKTTLSIRNLPDSPQNADAIVSAVAEWRGIPYVAGRCELGQRGDANLFVPSEGRYWVCVAVPGAKTEENQELSDRFEGAVIYYSKPVRIQAGELSTVKIDPSTKRPARKGGLNPADIPEFPPKKKKK
ncbi:MAG: hypothetical protein ACLFWL_18950, partial [Candidatus Brocadiia bacterium]